GGHQTAVDDQHRADPARGPHEQGVRAGLYQRRRRLDRVARRGRGRAAARSLAGVRWTRTRAAAHAARERGGAGRPKKTLRRVHDVVADVERAEAGIMALFFRGEAKDRKAAQDGALLLALVLQGWRPELPPRPSDEDDNEEDLDDGG